MQISFRTWLYAGLLLGAILGLFLFQLWQSERQVELHSEHLLEAVEQNDWEDVTTFIAGDYSDQWGHDRTLLLARLRGVLTSARNLQIEAGEIRARAEGEEGSWRARIRVEAEANEVSDYIKRHVNVLEEPFLLTWRQRSWKPWDWQLVGVTNPALELPVSPY